MDRDKWTCLSAPGSPQSHLAVHEYGSSQLRRVVSFWFWGAVALPAESRSRQYGNIRLRCFKIPNEVGFDGLELLFQ
jgi:hypothetical protein